MRITSKLKKSITVSLLALSTHAAAGEIKTPDQALDQLTGPNQPSRGKLFSSCVSVTPYFLSGWGTSSFFALTIDGIDQFGHKLEGAQCADIDANSKCDRGFVKIMSTVPLACHVPIAL